MTRMTSDINQAQAGVNLVLRLFFCALLYCTGSGDDGFDDQCETDSDLFHCSSAHRRSDLYYRKSYDSSVQKSAEQDGSGGASHRENYGGARVVRAFSRQEAETEEFRQVNEGLKGTAFSGRISALMNPLTYVLVNLAVIAILWQGGGSVDRGEITQGELTALINLYESDSAGTGGAGKSDHYSDQGGSQCLADQ